MRAKTAAPSDPKQSREKKRRDLPLRGCNPGQKPVTGAVQTVMRARQHVNEIPKFRRNAPKKAYAKQKGEIKRRDLSWKRCTRETKPITGTGKAVMRAKGPHP